MNDSRIIAQIKTGKKELFDTLIEKYYNSVYCYCYRHVDNQMTAQDLTQDVFVTVIKNISNYKHYGKFENYLYVIARNRCKDFWKKKQPLYLESLDKEESKQELVDVENKIFVKEALTKLPETEFEVVILRYYHDLKFKDIAKIMDSSVSVTKYRMSMALKKLEVYMEGGKV
ncbi:RNA polymerase sigma factor [Clostridioides sp. ES-S-0005-03]|uniref:RNA polymerase sigma factor n=1 Tax=unclassified Clostridioides TaxID=2635829 RepID=UPI001D109235|nr:RNA polymerase sigma factor [Clostridioides sp. ES-S-0005-03]UDN49278.1 RNA polymerase sigma factor [Clostridioides sp. ES-S-0173-01]UDN56576.1 RNA polymerase sigma factor [Clostridioides sp. ES-S-0010-02]